MNLHWKNSAFLAAFLLLGMTVAYAQTQGSGDNYDAERQKAIALLSQDKHLEALPLLEDLVRKKPDDSQTLQGLAVCLLSHSSTLETEDEEAAIKERVRARELLLESQKLGNNSPLLLTLLQKIPADGHLAFTNTPEDEAMRKGEAAFARRDFPEAIKNYSKALELNPKRYSAALFIGDSYFGAKDWPNAAQWYEKAIQIDPDKETAYGYYSDMLTKNGEMEKARKLAIQAVVAEPYNAVTWRGLEQWARTNKLSLTNVHVKVPENAVTKTSDKNIQINFDTSKPENTAAVWLAYSLKRALWQGDEFKKHFPQEKQYRHSLEEETEALTTAAAVCTELSESDAKKGKKKASPPNDPDLLLLLRLHQAKMIEPYVLLNAADEGIAQDYEGYRAKNRGTLESYLSDFVVPPAPGR